jgi:hypothetical protein
MSERITTCEGDVHVVPGVRGWLVRVDGRDRRPLKHWKQQHAIRRAREIARDNQSDLLIHGRDGRIRERAIYRPAAASAQADVSSLLQTDDS